MSKDLYTLTCTMMKVDFVVRLVVRCQWWIVFGKMDVFTYGLPALSREYRHLAALLAKSPEI